MLLDLTFENEGEGDAGGEHPQGGIGGAGDAKGTRTAHAVLEVLDIKAERGGDEDAGDIEASDNAMELGEALAGTGRKLHRDEQDGAGSHQAGGPTRPVGSS